MEKQVEDIPAILYTIISYTQVTIKMFETTGRDLKILGAFKQYIDTSDGISSI